MQTFADHGLYILSTETKISSELNRPFEWLLVKVPIELIDLNEFNNRFSPEEAMTLQEHEDAIKGENEKVFENLKKSMELNPQFQQLIAYYNAGMTKIKLIAGHRRYFAAKEAGHSSLLVWITKDVTPTEIEYIRDWPEVNPTEQKHSNFNKLKIIHDDFKGRTDEERIARLAVWKAKGKTKSSVEKAIRIIERMEDFYGSAKLARTNASKLKTFETYDQICEGTFKKLKDNMEFDKLGQLNDVAEAFIRAGHAHDDLKDTVIKLSDLPITDRIYTHHLKTSDFLSDPENLRRLTDLARSMKRRSDILTELKDFNARLVSRLIDNADLEQMEDCIAELKDTLSLIETAFNEAKGGSYEM